MNPTTPIAGMDAFDAMRAVGPALKEFRELEQQLPKTMTASANIDAASLEKMVVDYIVRQGNIIQLLDRIIATSDDYRLVRIATLMGIEREE